MPGCRSSRCQHRLCGGLRLLLPLAADVGNPFKGRIFAQLFQVFVLHQVLVAVPEALFADRLLQQVHRLFGLSSKGGKAVGKVVNLRLVDLIGLQGLLDHQLKSRVGALLIQHGKGMIEQLVIGHVDPLLFL